MNNELRACYERWLGLLNNQIEICSLQCQWPKEQISNIFTMCIDEAYVNTSRKIMFIGRETFGWYGSHEASYTTDQLMSFYAHVRNQHHNSPFWWFREKFSAAMGIGKEDFMQATLLYKKGSSGLVIDKLVGQIISIYST